MSEVDNSTDATESGPEMSTKALFGLLSDSRRRDAVRYLVARQHEVSLDELSAGIATRENPPSRQRLARISIDLHHVHLPKLADVGIVHYDPESGTVEPLAPASQLEPLLDGLDVDDD